MRVTFKLTDAEVQATVGTVDHVDLDWVVGHLESQGFLQTKAGGKEIAVVLTPFHLRTYGGPDGQRLGRCGADAYVLPAALLSYLLTSRSFTMSGGRLFSRSGRYTPQSVRPRFVRDCVRQRQSYEKRSRTQSYLRPVLRGNAHKPIGALACADAAARKGNGRGNPGYAYGFARFLFTPVKAFRPTDASR